jgi:hypothetical protein
MLKKVLVGFAIIIVALLVVIAFQPANYSVTRSASMAAPASSVFPHVNNFHKWKEWSPWAHLDPAMKETYEGPEAGTGAIYSWEGNRDVGAGRMTIVESRTNDLVRIKLEFLKPMEGINDTQFNFEGDGGSNAATRVTWTMKGTNNFMGKAFCLFMNMDKMIGGDFEKGLAHMKALAEAKSAGAGSSQAPIR